jgi:hypothetical protein
MFRGPDMYVVYIALIAYQSEKLLIKIGCTKNIGIRAQQLEADFGDEGIIQVTHDSIPMPSYRYQLGYHWSVVT